MHNVMGMDITINQGRDERIKDNKDNNDKIIARFDDLSLYLYMKTLAKVMIDK
jgi:hypothetical protein